MPLGTARLGQSRLYQRARAWLSELLANSDPLAAAANAAAFLVWSNQPFYPLYVWFIAGAAGWPSLLTWLSTPFFFAVALVNRRDGRAGRALLVVTGLANTLLAAKALGLASGVGWFLLPCGLIAVSLFHRREWPIALGLVAATLCATGLLAVLGAPLARITDTELVALTRLNLWSAGVLSAFILYSAVRARRNAGL